MITTAKGRRCASTGLTLVQAAGQISFRVAKDRYGALSVRKNSIVGPMPIGTAATSDSRGRYDSIGSTIYLADSRQCAYAEVGEERSQVTVVSGEGSGRKELEAFGQSCRYRCKSFEGPEGGGVVDLDPSSVTRGSLIS